jgi:hypothetical protein
MTAVSNAQPRKRQRGRRCKTLGCGGGVEVLRRRNFSDHIERRCECDRCGLRWTTCEKDLPNSIATEGEHGTKMAAQRLAQLTQRP